jgi:hypothetical protein
MYIYLGSTLYVAVIKLWYIRSDVFEKKLSYT